MRRSRGTASLGGASRDRAALLAARLLAEPSGPSRPTSVRECATLLDKLIYVLSNPIVEDLVAQARVWPGLITLPEDIVGQRTCTTERPDVYVSSVGLMPARTSIRLSRPPDFDHLTDDELLSLIEERLAHREREQKNRRRREGTRVIGSVQSDPSHASSYGREPTDPRTGTSRPRWGRDLGPSAGPLRVGRRCRPLPARHNGGPEIS
jgi:hypothetical protein